MGLPPQAPGFIDSSDLGHPPHLDPNPLWGSLDGNVDERQPQIFRLRSAAHKMTITFTKHALDEAIGFFRLVHILSFRHGPPVL